MFPSVSFTLTKGSARDLINTDEFTQLKDTGTIIIDERRRRTRWFDGRFLAAKDQIREQEYVLTRLADLGRAGGMGVVSGLMLRRSGPAAVIIGPGQGVTSSGELVLVPHELPLNLADIAAAEQIDAAFGLSRNPRQPARNRSGLFVLGLRPVEYTANPITSYPTHITGPRTVQDGDIVEAAAVVLIPYPDEGARGEVFERRSRVARRIFLENGVLRIPENVLPLAVIAMDRGIIQWLDAFLVRREVGAEHGSILGLGFAPRALREAHVLQYFHQLSEILSQHNASNRGQRFAASQYFEVLPPAGVMPSAAIDPADFSQIYFPHQMQADISIVPNDELAALIEESFLLPPIDLTDSADEMESTSVLVLVPVPRQQLPNLKAKLTTLTNALRPAVPGIVFQRKPIQSLLALTAVRLEPPPVNTGAVIDAAWRQALAQNPLLWYVRRRNLQVREDLGGVPTQVTGGRIAVAPPEVPETVAAQPDAAQLEAAKAAADKAAADKAAADQAAADKAAADKAAADQAAADRAAADKAAADKAAADKAAADKAAADKAAADRAAADRAAADRAAADKAAADRAAADRFEAARAEAARLEAARAEAARLEAARAETARLEAARAEAARLEAARAETARLEATRAEAARLEATRAEAAKLAAAKAAAEKAAAVREAAKLAAGKLEVGKIRVTKPEPRK